MKHDDLWFLFRAHKTNIVVQYNYSVWWYRKQKSDIWISLNPYRMSRFRCLVRVLRDWTLHRLEMSSIVGKRFRENWLVGIKNWTFENGIQNNQKSYQDVTGSKSSWTIQVGSFITLATIKLTLTAYITDSPVFFEKLKVILSDKKVFNPNHSSRLVTVGMICSNDIINVLAKR